MLDIKTIQTTLQTEIEIKHPITGNGLGAYITILGHEHPDRRVAFRDYNRILRKIGDVESEDQVEQRTEAHMRYIGACLSAWKGIGEDGVELPFSAAAATALLSKPQLSWMFNQVSLALIDQKNFIAEQPKA